MQSEYQHAYDMLRKWTAEKQHAHRRVLHWLEILDPRERDTSHASEMLKEWRSRERRADKLARRWANRVRGLKRTHFKASLELLGRSAVGDSTGARSDDTAEVVEELLAPLSVEEKFVIMRRFGLCDHPRSTLEGLGQRLGLTRERIRQIEDKAIKTIAKDANRIEIAAKLLETPGALEGAPAVRLVRKLRSEVVESTAEEVRRKHSRTEPPRRNPALVSGSRGFCPTHPWRMQAIRAGKLCGKCRVCLHQGDRNRRRRGSRSSPPEV
ncbi:MAG: sigma factor-like helix-turn-helix DNA-binding protein [Terriglobales bacterium]